VAGEKLGFPKGELEQEHPFVSEIAFDYKLKFHATAHRIGKRDFLTVVGAPETVLPLCKGYEHMRSGLDGLLSNMFEDGLRVLAVAVNSDAVVPLEVDKFGQLSFAGFFAIQDTLRPEVPDAMRRAQGAGIKVVMITGDHKLTAQAIAKQAGIYRDGDYVLTGEDIEHMTEPQLAQMIDKVTVFARVTPEHKLEIVNAYKKKGVIVAMTGDGVNDAPSLVAADLGVAMGKIGTEVAKEASDIVLLDDNFGSIVSAVEEGRSIYKTIKKVILYLFSTSAGEVLTITGALFLGLPLPLLAVQIIWLNFVTDGFLTVALGMEPKERGLLRGKFEKPNRFIIDSLSLKRIFIMALPMMLGSLYLFADNLDADLTKAWTVSLTTLAVFQWFNAWNCRSEHKSIFQMNPFSNKFLIAATGLVVVLQLVAVYNPLFQRLLHTAPLTLTDWMVILPVAFSIIAVEEVRKLLSRSRILTNLA
jgi:P-type Ca2+ transporter type 2C